MYPFFAALPRYVPSRPEEPLALFTAPTLPLLVNHGPPLAPAVRALHALPLINSSSGPLPLGLDVQSEELPLQETNLSAYTPG